MASPTPIAAVAGAAAPVNQPISVRLCNYIRLALSEGSEFSRPASLSDAAARCLRNLTSHPMNYLTALAIVGNPLALIFFIAWLPLYLFRPSYSPPFAPDGRPVSDGIVWTGLFVLIAVIFVPSTVRSRFIVSYSAGLAIIVGHAALRVPQDQFLGELGVGGHFLIGVRDGFIKATSCLFLGWLFKKLFGIEIQFD